MASVDGSTPSLGREAHEKFVVKGMLLQQCSYTPVSPVVNRDEVMQLLKEVGPAPMMLDRELPRILTSISRASTYLNLIFTSIGFQRQVFGAGLYPSCRRDNTATHSDDEAGVNACISAPLHLVSFISPPKAMRLLFNVI
jgi:hypothetical protein